MLNTTVAVTAVAMTAKVGSNLRMPGTLLLEQMVESFLNAHPTLPQIHTERPRVEDDLVARLLSLAKMVTEGLKT
jgi:hypothetical protein